MSSFLKPLIFSLMLATLCLLAVFAGSEIFVRVAKDDGMQYDIEMWKYAKRIKRIADNSQIGHEHQPKSQSRLMGVDVSINSMGLRDREISILKPKDTTRIVMIGDSLTFGWGVSQDGTFSRVLEAALRREKSKFEVINTGVGNYNTVMAVTAFLEKYKDLQPDIVILNYFINDAEKIPSYRTTFLQRHSMAWIYFAARVDSALRAARREDRQDWRSYYLDLYETRSDHGNWKAAENAISKLADWAQRENVRMMIVHHPELRHLNPYPFSAITSRVQALSKDMNIPFLDLLPSLAQEPAESLWVTRPDPHPNGRAHRLAGEAIYKWVRPLILPKDEGAATQ